MTNRTVGERYTLEREIGRGGSGPVWLAHDLLLGRRVALKRIGLPPGAADADTVRAEREARLAARVNHPHVVAVFDLVATDDDHWLVMEYVEGSTLAAQIRARGRLTADEVAPLLRQVADALTAAHAADIVHRDVKPSNILIATDGSVKLSDFGIARAIADVSLTQTGLVTGSPAYLAPEVASGSTATPASDVWSFGATLFHALAGAPPYDVKDNLVGALYRIVHEAPPRLPDPGWLGPLLAATMTKEPAARPEMAAVAAYLRQGTGATPLPAAGADGAEDDATATRTFTSAATPPPPPSPPRGRPRRRRRPGAAVIGAATVAVLAVLGIGLLLLDGGDGEPDTDGQSAAPGTVERTEPSPSQSSTPPEPPTVEELEEFARTYVATASSDPDAGFGYLTEEYQASSPGYRDFWGSITNPRISQVSGDPDAMTTTYTYSYSQPGQGRRTEVVTLNLVQTPDGLRIASATAEPAG